MQRTGCRLREFVQQVFVVAVAEAKAGRADALFFQTARDDLPDLRWFNDSLIEVAVRQQQQLPRNFRRGLREFITSEHPPSSEILVLPSSWMSAMSAWRRALSFAT